MLHPVAASLKDEQMPMMNQTIYHGCRHLLVCEDASPLGELEVGGKDEALALVTITYA